jgi:signal transduction histidine kinase
MTGEITDPVKVTSGTIFQSSIRIISWGLIYYFVAWFSLSYLIYPNGVAMAWPPVGIFISSILLTRAKERPFLIMVMMIADVAADLHSDISLVTKFVYALLSTGDALISAMILLRFVANPFVFTKAKNFILYILFSVFLCNGLFSILVALETKYAQGSPFLTGFLSSWVADGVGNLMVVPFIISWASFSKADFKYWDFKKMLEIAVLIILLVVSNSLTFPLSEHGLLFSFIINYLSFPFIIWAIFRFDLRIVTLVLLLLTLVMIISLMKDIEMFSKNSFNWNFIFFQLYIASISFISILITSIITERNQARKALTESERKLLFNTVEIEERERSRYSLELHDGLGPLLSTIKMYLQSISDTQDNDKLKYIAEESQHSIKLAIQTMREVAHGLSPFNLNKLGYVDAILDFANGINKTQELVLDFSFNSNERFSDFYEIMLFRITTELINNTIKHAGATHAETKFNYQADKKRITLEYNDNGKGFDTFHEERAKNGMGLQNIHQRIEILGGNCFIESSIGKGTHVYIDFPVNENNIKVGVQT